MASRSIAMATSKDFFAKSSGVELPSQGVFIMSASMIASAALRALAPHFLSGFLLALKLTILQLPPPGAECAEELSGDTDHNATKRANHADQNRVHSPRVAGCKSEPITQTHAPV